MLTEGKILVILYLFAFVWVILLIPPIRRLAFLIGALDRPGDPRKVHTRIIPRFGGPAVFLAFFLSVGLSPFLSPQAREFFWLNAPQFGGLIAACTIVLAAGMYDDVKGLGGKIKFLLIMFAAAILWWSGIRIDRLYIPWRPDTAVGWYISLPVTVIWVTICAAALNLIDGLDGLATGVTLIASITLLFLSYGAPDRGWETLLCASLIGAVVAFLIFNFHPAKIFLGDSGALFLGFLIGAISVKSSFKSTTIATFIVPIVVLGLPILDTSLVVLSRWVRRVSIFSPDKLHLHHRLMALGLSQSQAVFVFYVVSIVFGGAAVFLSYQRGQWLWLPVAAVGLLIVILLRILRCEEVAVAATHIVNRILGRRAPPRSWLEMGAEFQALEQAKDLVALWRQITGILEAFGVQYAALKLEPEAFPTLSPEERLSWEWHGVAAPNGTNTGARWSATYDLEKGSRKLGVLYLEREVSGGLSIEGLGDVVNKLAETVTGALSRLATPAEASLKTSPAPNP